MNPTYIPLLVAVLAFFTGIGGSLLGGYFLLRSKDRENDAKRAELEAKTRLEESNLAHQIRDELRGDNKELKAEIVKLEGEIKELREQVRILSRDRETHDKSRQKAENELRRERGERQKAEARARASEEKYVREHAACNLFAQLHDFMVSGRVPDTVMLETINRGLRDLGYLTKEESNK